jgi:hypothetical protein
VVFTNITYSVNKTDCHTFQALESLGIQRTLCRLIANINKSAQIKKTQKKDKKNKKGKMQNAKGKKAKS